MAVTSPLCKVCGSRHWGMAHVFLGKVEVAVVDEVEELGVVTPKVRKGGAEKKPKPAASEGLITGSVLKERLEGGEAVEGGKVSRAEYMRVYMAARRAAAKGAK